MSATPFFKCFPSDFLNGIADMGPAEIAVYTVIIMRLYDEDGKILEDVQKIARRCNMRKPACQKAIDQLVLDDKLQRSGQHLTQRRAAKEILKRTETSAKQSRNAQQREHVGGKNTNKNNGSDDNWHNQKVAKKKPSIFQKPDTRSHKEEVIEPTEVVSKKSSKGTRITDDWLLPEDWLAFSVDEGLTELESLAQADRFKDYWLGVAGAKGVKRDWKATWRNWIRNSNDWKQNAGSNQNKPKPLENHLRGMFDAAEQAS